MEEKQYKNKVVIITGASSGIGKACALEFAGKGAKVVLAARRIKELKIIEKGIIEQNGNAFSVKTDVKNIEDCKNLISKTVEKYGKIDVLINNAGISMRSTFIDLDLSVIKEIMDTNFYGAVYCTKFALPHITKQKGTVIGISSIAGLAPLPGRTGYVASKHAMNGFFNTLRLENIKKEVNVLIVHPGFTESRIRKNALNKIGIAQKESPRDEKEMMPAIKVAKAIAKAYINGERSLVLTRQGKLAVWMYKIFPLVADLLIYNQMASELDHFNNSFSKIDSNKTNEMYENVVLETIDELSDIKISEIGVKSSFEYLEFDDLDLAELIMILEDRLNITADDSMYYAKTVGELIEKLNKQIQTNRN